MLRRSLLALAALPFLAASAAQAQAISYVVLKGKSFYVEVADNDPARMKGLMFREHMPADRGMIFLFPEEAMQAFWMKNTLIPLAVAFVADDGTVVNVDEMKPQTLNPHCSTKPVRFVLEMNTGWFAKRGIKEGSKLSGAPFGTPR